MSAQPQTQPDMPQPERKSRTYRQSTDNRVVALETQWETVLPTLATKADLSDLKVDLTDRIAQSEQKAANGLAEVKSEVAEVKNAITRLESAVREMRADIKAEIKSDSSNQLKWVVGTMLAGLGGVVGIMALLLSVMSPEPVAPVQQPAPIIQPAPPITADQPAPATQSVPREGNP